MMPLRRVMSDYIFFFLVGYFDYAYEAMADVTGWHRSSSGQ